MRHSRCASEPNPMHIICLLVNSELAKSPLARHIAATTRVKHMRFRSGSLAVQPSAFDSPSSSDIVFDLFLALPSRIPRGPLWFYHRSFSPSRTVWWCCRLSLLLLLLLLFLFNSIQHISHWFSLPTMTVEVLWDHKNNFSRLPDKLSQILKGLGGFQNFKKSFFFLLI